MESIGERLIWHYVPFTNIPIPMGGVNVLTIFNTIVVMVVLLGLMAIAVRRASRIPTGGQVVVEQFVGAFDNLVGASLDLGETEKNRRFLPYIAALFVFLVLSNFMGFFPTRIFEEPTGDVNTTLALGIMAIVIATYCGMKAKGTVGYINELMGPMWSQPGIAGKLSALFFFPLNIIGEMAKVVSISFRLFGNIIGGSIIIVVVSTLIFNVVLPVGLDLFFVFFVGAVQAFVFTMLTLTYIAVAIK